MAIGAWETSGVAITTIPDVLLPAVPADVQIVSVDGEDAELAGAIERWTAEWEAVETEIAALS